MTSGLSKERKRSLWSQAIGRQPVSRCVSANQTHTVVTAGQKDTGETQSSLTRLCACVCVCVPAGIMPPWQQSQGGEEEGGDNGGAYAYPMAFGRGCFPTRSARITPHPDLPPCRNLLTVHLHALFST